MTKHTLLDGVLAGLADPANYLAMTAGPSAIKTRLRMGVSPISMASDWFSNPDYDKELRVLALVGNLNQVRLSGCHPDEHIVCGGAVSLLAAAVDLHRYEEIVHLLTLGADPYLLVDPGNPNPRARTILGKAMTSAMSKPEDWLSFFSAFGRYADSYAYQAGHFRWKAEVERDPYSLTL